MGHPDEMTRPRVFLSFAGDDRETAMRLGRDLRSRGIDVFVDRQDIELGRDFVLAIDDALTQSDYFVLLWSRATVDRKWVAVEWSAALAHEIDGLAGTVNGRRSFFFIVRLDATPLPLLLAPRRYLDAFDRGWDEVVNELAATWRRDQALGLPVLPAPRQVAAEDTGGHPTIVVYLRNRDLSVAHVIAVPAASTGRELERLVRARLALPDTWTGFGGAIRAHFYYQFMHAGKPIPGDEKLAALHIADGSTIDIEVRMESFGPGRSSSNDYRGSASLTPVQTRFMVKSAFGHLMPW